MYTRKINVFNDTDITLIYHKQDKYVVAFTDSFTNTPKNQYITSIAHFYVPCRACFPLWLVVFFSLFLVFVAEMSDYI